MSLEDLIPDDAGSGGVGRPPSKELGQTIEPAGEPYLPENDDEQWWLERLDDIAEKEPVLGENTLDEMEFHHSVEVIGALSDLVSLHPVEVRKKLSEHEIYETEWEDYIGFYDDTVLDDRVPHYDGEDFTPTIKENPWDDDDSSQQEQEEKEGGLHGLIEDAKK